MSDWDDDDGEFLPKGPSLANAAPRVVSKRNKWEDEEEDDGADDWDAASEGEEGTQDAVRVQPLPTKQRRNFAQAAEERNAQRKLQEEDEGNFESNSDEELDERERDRRRKQKAQEAELQADLLNAQDLFGTTNLNGKSLPTKTVSGASSTKPGGSRAVSVSSASSYKKTLARDTIATADPKSGPQFDAFLQSVTTAVVSHSKKPFYLPKLPQFIKDVCRPLNSADIKTCVNALTALQEEVARQERATQKTAKKSSKPDLNVAAKGRKAHFNAFEDDVADDLDEYDDFM